MKGGLFKMATTAGLIGLAVMHADALGTVATKAVASFRAAVHLA